MYIRQIKPIIWVDETVRGRGFVMEPIEHKRVCMYGVGEIVLGGFNCTICGYFIPCDYKVGEAV